jgi:hypothetical protein
MALTFDDDNKTSTVADAIHTRKLEG